MAGVVVLASGNALAQEAVAGAGDMVIAQGDGESARERRRLVAAASEAAVDRLMRNIEAEIIRPGLTVGKLLDALGPSSREELRRLVAAGRQVGGPRFPIPGTAEVQLQVNGEDVAATLVRLASDRATVSPITGEELRRLGLWEGRPFVATGGSVASVVGAELRPPADRMPPSWIGVSGEGTSQAIGQAKDDAVSKLIKAAGPVNVLKQVPPPGRRTSGEDDEQDNGAQDRPAEEDPRPLTLDDVFSRDGGSVEAEARQWLSERPYSRLVFGDGRKVEVKLAVEPQEWVDQLRVSMANPELGLPQIPDEEWEAFVARLAERLRSAEVGPIVGEAVAVDPANVAAALILPQRAPEWTRLPVTVQATSVVPEAAAGANPAQQRLMARSAATALARQGLRTRLEALQAGENQTVGQLARVHPNVATLLDEAVKNAPVKGVSYDTNLSATVQLSINPIVFWQALQRYAAPVAQSQSLPQPD